MSYRFAWSVPWTFTLGQNITVACGLEKARKHGWWDGAGYNLDPYETPIKVKQGVIAILGPEAPRGKAMRVAA